MSCRCSFVRSPQRSQSSLGSAFFAFSAIPCVCPAIFVSAISASSATLLRMKTTNRRKFIVGSVAAAAASAGSTRVAAQEKPVKKVHYRNGRKPERTPLFNSTVSVGNLVFIAGVGYHQEGDIKVHTKAVLDQIQQQLENVGSSMEKVVKCNVYLNDLKDYAGMNEMFQGRFGAEPPVRTTIAAAGGIPGNSLVEIDVIATL